MPTIDFFKGGAVIDYDPAQGIQNPKRAHRLLVDYDGGDIGPLIDAIAEDPKLGELESLIIGQWYGELYDDEDGEYAAQMRDKLIEIAPKMTSLEALVWGDISYEESEISWIYNCDVGPLINAFPNLTYFKARGGNNLRFTNVKHDKLQKFKVETGGMNLETIQDICNMELPALELIDLWLGTENYGFEATADDLKPLIIGKAYPDQSYPFPKLTSLGLCNSDIADELAELFIDGAIVLKQIKTLDMSMGTMTNRGIEAFLQVPDFGTLKKIDLHNNAIEDEDLVDQLRAKGVKVDIKDQKDPDDAYVDVGE